MRTILIARDSSFHVTVAGNNLFQPRVACALALALAASFSFAAEVDSAHTAAAKTSVLWSQIGAKAGAAYTGDGLTVTRTAEGARLRCVFQQLEGEATREGLWLTSTVIPPRGKVNDRFRLVVASLGRWADAEASDPITPCQPTSFDGLSGFGLRQSSGAFGVFAAGPKRQGPAAVEDAIALARNGTVQVVDKVVRFTRPGLVEEYTVGMDGVRQDLVVLERPAGTGELAVRLAMTGARVEQTASGAQLVLANSGRKIAYSRLQVTDATGKELSARMEVQENSGFRIPKSEVVSRSHGPMVLRSDVGLAVVVDDTDAIYPVRIDPTFSDANWISMGGLPGVYGIPGNGPDVRGVAVDGSGNVYIVGRFTLVGDVFANNIAKWDGTSWSALGSGIDAPPSPNFGGGGYALAAAGSNLYVGGNFTTAGGNAAANIAKWNGSSWSALGSGISGPSGYPYNDGTVVALAVSGSDLYAAGYITTAGGIEANSIAKWDGSSWSALGSGVSPDGIHGVGRLAVLGSDLYAGGYFTMAGGIAAKNIAKWDGSSWSALGSGISATSDSPYFGGSVSALAAAGSDLYVGGNFTTAGGITANNIAKWDGSSWTPLGSGMNGSPGALAVSGTDLYAGGYFTTAGGIAANNIAKWDGSSWSPVGSGIDGPGHALAVSGSDVYAGGWFTTAGGSPANFIAKWNGSSWSALGSGMDNSLGALVASGSDLYAGGQFTTAGGSVANHIAKWNGSSWSALGSGMGGVDYPGVSALAVSGSDVYAGGWFTTAGGTAATNIAKWDGSSWSALGSGMGGGYYPFVYTLAVSGSDLYAGGEFTTAGGNPANYIAKWDGSTWSALGSGMNGRVWALAVSGSDLYAGGEFTTAGGTAATNIAKWDGSSWSALSSGMDGVAVYALAVSGGDLYAGGAFATAGGSPAIGIAKWNGSSWSALGSGMDGQVSALAVSGSDLYAGGAFATAGGSVANCIAKWNGSSWSALGSGMNGGVSALAVSGSDLYVGGTFTTAGGKVSAYLAKAIVYPLAFDSFTVSNATFLGLLTGPASTSVIVDGSATFNNWSPVATNILPVGGWQLSLPLGTNAQQFYRARFGP